ncbi:MAG: HIRAN domain-containing protein [Oscillospiraceae bacterium]
MKKMYVTITGINHYYGKAPFKIGNVIACKKEPSNEYDSEAIKAFLPMIGTIGYVANSSYTYINGTMSAGRVYDKVKEIFFVRVMFVTKDSIICKVELDRPNVSFDEELKTQIEALMTKLNENDEDDYEYDDDEED